jgi:hypothetical protein
MNIVLTIWQSKLNLSAGLVLFFIMVNTSQTLAQFSFETDTVTSIPDRKEIPASINSLKITSMGFGGTVLKFSRVNNQFAVMNGGRGSVTINRRFTIGGGGYGIVNRISLESNSNDTYRFLKMGYGGLELGYIFFPGQKLNVGSSLLIAGGAVFTETLPKTKENSFQLFPVLEPSLYGEVKLSKMIRLQTGLTYRYINGTKLDLIAGRKMSGFSVYFNLLFGTCG